MRLRFLYRHLLTPKIRRGYVGVDSHIASLDRFNELSPQAQTKEGSLEILPIDDASVDVVLGLSVYPLFFPQVGAERELARVLKPGGRLALIQE